MKPVFENNNKERVPFEHYLALYQGSDPREIAARTALAFHEAEQAFTVELMGCVYQVTFPDFEIVRVSGQRDCLSAGWAPGQILLLRYLTNGTFTQSSGRFLAYPDMPWGNVYYQQFSGRCIMRLARTFDHKAQRLRRAMESIGARPYDKGDSGYEFSFMKGLDVRVSLWDSDEEFPPSAQILFSDNFPSAFTAEDMAFVGDTFLKSLSMEPAD